MGRLLLRSQILFTFGPILCNPLTPDPSLLLFTKPDQILFTRLVTIQPEPDTNSVKRYCLPEPIIVHLRPNNTFYTHFDRFNPIKPFLTLFDLNKH